MLVRVMFLRTELFPYLFPSDAPAGALMRPTLATGLMLLVVSSYLFFENHYCKLHLLSLLSLATPDRQMACYAFDGLSHSFVSFAYQEVEVVAHEAVDVIAAVTATGVALVIVLKAHAVEGVDELVVVFLIFKDGLMINTTHHHMVYTGA